MYLVKLIGKIKTSRIPDKLAIGLQALLFTFLLVLMGLLLEG